MENRIADVADAAGEARETTLPDKINGSPAEL